MKTLLLKLVNQAQGPTADMLDAKAGLGNIWTLADYCQQAKTIIETGKVNTAEFREVLDIAEKVDGDAGEYALDFLRRISPAMKNEALEILVTNAHLKIIAEQSFDVRSQVDRRPRALKIARRCADRGLTIIDESNVQVNPDIHADLLLAKGQTYTHPSEPKLDRALRLFLQALDKKELAGNLQDIQKLRGLLAQMCKYQMSQVVFAGVIGGVGEALNTLKVSYEATQRLGEANLIIECGLSLAEALGQVRQADEAVDLVREILARDDITAKQSFDGRFILAARLSELEHRNIYAVAEARKIGEQLVKDLPEVDTGVPHQTVWMNLGNFRRLDDDLKGAREAFETAMGLCPELGPDQIPEQQGQIKALLAETEILLGHFDKGKQLLKEAEADFKHVIGFSKIHFESLAAKYAMKMGDAKKSALHSQKGFSAIRFILEKRPSPDVWESVFREWTSMDVVAVQAYHAMGGNANLEKALLIAEAAKGRLFEWLVRARWDEEAAQNTLDPTRQENALKRIREWAMAGQRWGVSLFGHREGLSITAISPTGEVMGAWLDDFDYDILRLKVFEPWEEALEAASNNGDRLAEKLAATVVDLLLESIGNFLWRAIPELSDGGEDLVLLPHRIFRSLPVCHALLPNGKRLTQLFERVTVCASLTDFARMTSHSWAESKTTYDQSIVDADGSLPFARLEGLTAFGKENLAAGAEVTLKKLKTGLKQPGTLLLSCHGDFNEQNPWSSGISVADGELILGELLKQGNRLKNRLVILGVCEAGKARHSLSDEPVSFPSLLISLGAGLVIAPLWKVEDFSSFLFIKKLNSMIQSGIHPARAIALTATWQQTLTAKKALIHLNDLKGFLTTHEGIFDSRTSEVLLDRISEYTYWLADDMLPNEYPFNALDWAAYQIMGYCTE